MKYRYATTADVAVLANMNVDLIRDEGHRNPMSVGELQARMADWLSGEYQAVLFEDDGEPVGYALFRREPQWVYVRQFFVVSTRRRRGVGRAAVDWLLNNAWPQDIPVRLDVLTGNAGGIAFWRSLGFGDYCITMERAR
jgi:GNAT superfamily N-acetyltransferase